MEAIFDFVEMLLSLLLSSITIILTITAVAPVTLAIAKQQQVEELELKQIIESDFEQYDDTVVYGTEVFNAIYKYKDSDIGIIVELPSESMNTTGYKSKYVYNAPISVTDDSDMTKSFLDYLPDENITLDKEKFGKEDDKFVDCKFYSKLIKTKSNAIVGIFFKKE